MECSRVLEKLSCFVDGVLDEHTLEMVESHLAECEGCRRELASLRALVRAAASIPEAHPPSGLKQQVRLAVRDSKQHARRCGQVSGLLSAHLDGKTTSGESVLVASHLRECEECASEARVLRTLVEVTRTIDEVAPPANLRSRILSAVANEPAPRASILSRWLPDSGWTRWAGGAVAAGAVAVAAMTTLPGTPEAPRKIDSAPVRATAPKVRPATPAPIPDIAVASLAAPKAEAKEHVRQARKVRRIQQSPAPAAVAAAPVKTPSPAKRVVTAATESTPTPSMELDAKLDQPVSPADSPEPTEAVAAPAPPAGSGPGPQKRGEPALKVAIATAFSEDAQEWAKQAKSEASMRKGEAGAVGFQIITSRF